jgi:hypothetical protein
MLFAYDSTLIQKNRSALYGAGANILLAILAKIAGWVYDLNISIDVVKVETILA